MAESVGISAPVTVDLGKEQVQFFPLGMAEWKAMELTLLHRRRERHIAAAWDTTTSLPDDLRRELAKEAVQEAKAMVLLSVEVRTQKKTKGIPDLDRKGNPVMVTVLMDAVNAWIEQTYEGKMFAIWLSMKRDPAREGITEQEVSDLLMTKGIHGMEIAFSAMLAASGMSDEGNSPGPSSKTKSSKGKEERHPEATQTTST